MPSWLGTHGITAAAALAAGALALVLVSLTRPAPPTIEVRPREPQPTPTVVIYTHVDGAVVAPGVYALPGGARIFEAIDAAGGAAEDADLRELNLAAKVADGQKLVVPWRPAAPVALVDDAPQPVRPAAGPPVAIQAAARINVNTATQRVLETLPGVGPVTAGRIVEYRQANGPFTRVEQLREARLVNAPTYERIKNLIAVD